MRCVFCKIVRGQLPCYKVYEDAVFLAFLDIRPLNPGHTLLIPKTHYRWVWDVPEIGSYFETARKLARALRKAMKTSYIALGIAGEEVKHAHLHLIPRFKNDGHGAWLDPSNVKQLSAKEMERITERIRKTLKT